MGGHDRLVVDYTLLGSSKSNLREINKALKDIDSHGKDIRDIWGHDSIADKMGEFVTNWDNYRRELVDNVEDLGNHVEGALKSFDKRDLDLKNAIEKKEKDGGK
ncbi:hypothetical protein [Streptomyces sp. bgisy100]|uniref:hypothetical protein n=1 Tax=Streptomyces sp. bgisy100 TaxID=3413783 RepID=UPI003D73112F